MAGHSRWASIGRCNQTLDARRAKLLTAINFDIRVTFNVATTLRHTQANFPKADISGQVMQ